MNSLIKSNPITKLDRQLDYILLDGSASMADKWPDTLAAVDAYVEELRSQGIRSHIYLHLFSSGNQLDLCAFHDDIEAWAPMLGRLDLPCGGTPLYDAISLTARRMRDFDPPNARVTIATDGEEMGSTHTDETQARSFLDWMRAKGWPVTFIGCDFSNSSLARRLGADDSNAIGVQKKLLAAAAKNYAKKAANHARGADGIDFTKDEQQQFGGYLAAPEAK
jgi:hypothetical protein